MKLKPDTAQQYRERHDAIWPELKQLLKEAGVSEYSIFLDPETNALFAFQKVAGDAGSQALKDNPIVQKWWAHMADLMEVHEDNSPVSISLDEVFYLP